MMRTHTCLAVLFVVSTAASPPARAEESKIEIVDFSIDPSNQPRFGQELKMRVTVRNRTNAPAKGMSVEIRRPGGITVRLVLAEMGAAEQRTLPISTGVTLGAGEACFTVVPVPGSGASAGPGRPYCVTPGCYTVAEQPER